MEEYIFTPKGYEALLKVIQKTEEKMQEASKSKSDAASGQDGWHDEGFKSGAVDEMMWSRRLGELQAIQSNAHIVEPEEQNETVQLGNGVIVEYDDGKIFKFILEGYIAESLEGRVSIHGPLGNAVAGGKKGETIAFQGASGKRRITIKKILPPSKAEGIFL